LEAELRRITPASETRENLPISAWQAAGLGGSAPAANVGLSN
jgi:hypothetical protein